MIDDKGEKLPRLRGRGPGSLYMCCTVMYLPSLPGTVAQYWVAPGTYRYLLPGLVASPSRYLANSSSGQETP